MGRDSQIAPRGQTFSPAAHASIHCVMQLTASTHGGPSPRFPLAEGLRGLRRAVATVRSYPAGNELTERTLRDLDERLRLALPVHLVLGPGTLRDPNGATLDADEGLRALVADLYRDGVRELLLDAGLARPELDRLVTALAEPLDSQDLTEDYVTRLWEAELPSVKVVALDPYLDREIPGDVLEGKARPSGETEGIPSGITPSLPPPPEEAFQLSAIDRENLQNERAKNSGPPPWAALVSAVLDVAGSRVAARRAAEIVSVVESVVYCLVNEGQLALAAEVLRGAYAEAQLPPALLAQVASRAASPDRLEALRSAVERDPSAQAPARDLLNVLGPASLPVVDAFLRSAATAGPRRFWAELLGSMGEDGLAALSAAARGADAEVAVAAARVLGATGDARFARVLWSAFVLAEGSSRREILRIAAALGENRAGLLDVAVGDVEEDCRLIALRCLPRAVDRGVEGRLLARLASPEAEWLAEREIDALHRALVQAGAERTVEYLAKQLSGGWLSGRNRAGQMRAARALARMASPGAAAVLRERAEGRGAAAEACRRALRERGSRGEP